MALAVAKGTPVKKAGGDDSVERDGNGRPRIIVTCDKCDGTGTVPSAKVAGRMNKCQPCSGEGRRKKSYTRVTTLADTLEDKEQIITWRARMVLIGAAMDTGFLTDVLSMDPAEKSDKDALNRRAEAAADLAGASAKADHGSLVHEYTELVDDGKDLPLDADPMDWVDVQSYARATQPILSIVHMEQLVVCDELGTAGTPDRVSHVRLGVELVAPDGHVFTPDELIITDLKTGRVDLGGLKMAMQLSIYAHSHLYDKETGARVPLGNVNQKWGIIMHTPWGEGRTTLYWVDLELGWNAVLIAKQVRSLRSAGRRALAEFSANSIAA